MIARRRPLPSVLIGVVTLVAAITLTTGERSSARAVADGHTGSLDTATRTVLPRLTRAGSTLRAGGRTVRLAGANAYWLALNDNTRDPSTGAATIPAVTTLQQTLDAVRAMNGNVVRVHTAGISYGDTEGNGTPTLMPRPGVYREVAFQAVDQIFAEAGRRGLWLVVPMADRWSYYHGGGATFARLVLGPAATLEDFYRRPEVRQAFKDYLRTWLTRVNSVTGVAYKDDPTLAILELGNEMYDAPASWTSEMAAFVKSVAPRVLVADPTAASGKYVTDSNVALTDPNVDVFGDHFYPRDHWWLDSDTGAVTRAGKVFMLGEFDWTGGEGLGRPGSNVTLRDWLTQIQNDPRISVSAWWTIQVPSTGRHDDGYGLTVPTASALTGDPDVQAWTYNRLAASQAAITQVSADARSVK